MQENTNGFCPLCEFASLVNASWRAMYNPYPVSLGHVLIIPHRHDADFFNLTEDEWHALQKLLERVKEYFEKYWGGPKPDGY